MCPHDFFPSRPEGTKDIVEDNSKEEQIIKEKRLNVCCHRQIAYVSYHWFEMVWTFSDSTTFLWALACPEEKHIVSKAESLELALYKMQELHSKSVGTSQDATRENSVTDWGDIRLWQLIQVSYSVCTSKAWLPASFHSTAFAFLLAPGSVHDFSSCNDLSCFFRPMGWKCSKGSLLVFSETVSSLIIRAHTVHDSSICICLLYCCESEVDGIREELDLYRAQSADFEGELWNLVCFGRV